MYVRVYVRVDVRVYLRAKNIVGLGTPAYPEKQIHSRVNPSHVPCPEQGPALVPDPTHDRSQKPPLHPSAQTHFPEPKYPSAQRPWLEHAGHGSQRAPKNMGKQYGHSVTGLCNKWQIRWEMLCLSVGSETAAEGAVL